MKIAIATGDFESVASHAGQSRRWLLYDCVPGVPIAPPRRIDLDKHQVFHHFEDDRPHPLDGVEIIIAGSAGDGFLRRMQTQGVTVLLTGERDARKALEKVLAGEALEDPRFDATTLLCRLRDLFSKH